VDTRAFPIFHTSRTRERANRSRRRMRTDADALTIIFVASTAM